jgi:two-component system cell cycle sensor histidine kinase/response regulator CckA
MNSLRLRLMFPLWLFGFLPAMGVTRLMGNSLDWFFGVPGVLLGGGAFLGSYLLSGWMLRPATAVTAAAASVMRGVPPSAATAEWLPQDFWKLRSDINMLFAKHRQALSAAEAHACQTEQRLLNAERLVREAFTAMQGIFAASDECVVVVDSDGAIVASNARMDEFLGSPLEDIAGRNGKTMLAAVQERMKDGEKMKNWVALADDNADFEGDLEIETNDSSPRTMMMRTAPMRAESGESVGRLWMLRDRTQVRGLEQQLRQSQKMGTLGLIAGGIAHDFNNLLTAIRGNLTLAEMTPPDQQAEVKDCLDGATQATVRAAELVKQLLGYSRRSEPVRKVTNMKQVVADAQSLLKHSVDPRITVRSQANVDSSFAVADATQLEQVLLNLGINARDALPAQGGIIEMAIENVDRQMNENGEKGEYVMISVRDNGHGVPVEDRQRIFEPFFTTKEAGKGTGLGLATAQDIIREHGGWIEFDTELGRGTEFRIILPRVASGAAKDDEIPESIKPMQQPTQKRGTVLVVDDEAPVRSIAVNMLRFMGFEVLEAGDGQQALDVIQRSGSLLDVILLDIYMPKLSGRDTFKQMRAQGNNTPVVVCSGFVLDPDEFIVLSQGRTPPVDIMLKPYSLEALTRAINKALAISGEQKMSPAVVGSTMREPVLTA